MDKQFGRMFRILLGTILPVPTALCLYIFHQTGSELFGELVPLSKFNNDKSTPILPWIVSLLFFGYLFMGIPSFIFSIIIEWTNRALQKSISWITVIIGTLIGYFSGLIINSSLLGAVSGMLVSILLTVIFFKTEPAETE